MAVLELLSGTAGARIVAADLRTLYDRGGSLLCLVELLALLFGENGIPLRELIQPLGLCADHVVIELLWLVIKGNLRLGGHVLQVVFRLDALVDAVKVTGHFDDIHAEVVSECLYGAALRSFALEELLVKIPFSKEILCPVLFCAGFCGLLVCKIRP